MFEVKECSDPAEIKELFVEYSQLKGAESCFVSFDRELSDLASFYADGLLLVGYENGYPVGSLAVKRIDKRTGEAKRLYIKPDHRGKGYSRIMLNAMLDKCRDLGIEEIRLSTKPSVMPVAYELYKKMGFTQVNDSDGVVEMRLGLA